LCICPGVCPAVKTTRSSLFCIYSQYMLWTIFFFVPLEFAPVRFLKRLMGLRPLFRFKIVNALDTIGNARSSKKGSQE
jgi:hypothetical protein